MEAAACALKEDSELIGWVVVLVYGCRVLTVRDFTTVFDAYAQCEESLLTARIQMLDDQEADEDDDEEEKVSPSMCRGVSAGRAKAVLTTVMVVCVVDKVEDDLDVEGDDTELRLARLEDLMERRPVAVRTDDAVHGGRSGLLREADRMWLCVSCS